MTGARQSSAYLLAMAALSKLMQRKAVIQAAQLNAGGDEPASAAREAAAQFKTLPDGNHGETFEVTKK